MNVLHLLISGGLGGIETLCKNIVLTSQENHYLCFFWEGGPVLEPLQKAGKEYFLLGDKKRQIWQTQKKLRQICREKQIQVVNLQHEGPFVDLQFFLLKCAFPKIRFVSTEHSFAEYYTNQISNRMKKWMWHFFYCAKLRSVDLVLAVSESVRRSYIERYQLPEEKVHLVYNGISKELLDAGAAFLHKKEKEQDSCVTEAERKYRILYVGRMDGLKGCEYLIEAVSSMEDVELTLVGDGVQRKELENLVKEKSLTNSVFFAGYQTNLARFFEKTDIFVYPPIVPEAFGLSPVEAMAFGIPCIVTKMGGLQEIVREGENGYLCEAADSYSLHCAIRKIVLKYKDGEIRSFQTAARRTAEGFSIEKTVTDLEREYREL